MGEPLTARLAAAGKDYPIIWTSNTSIIHSMLVVKLQPTTSGSGASHSLFQKCVLCMCTAIYLLVEIDINLLLVFGILSLCVYCRVH